MRELNLPPITSVSHRYCFTTGQNGDSFYLKLGASCKWTTTTKNAFQFYRICHRNICLSFFLIISSCHSHPLTSTGFAFGLVVYSALQCSYDAYFISSNGNHLFECASYMTLTLNILFPIYSLFSLYFIVKYMNIVVNVNQNVARLLLMHSIGTSLSLWLYTIFRETADAIAEFDAENHGKIPIKILLNFLLNRKCIFTPSHRHRHQCKRKHAQSNEPPN